MSLRKTVGVVAFGSAVALALYGVGCGGSSGGSGTGGTSGSGGESGSGGSSGSGGGSSGTGGSKGSSGTKGSSGSAGTAGSGGTSGTFGEAGGDSGSCTFMPLGSFTPGLNPSAQTPGTCTAADITAVIAACFSAASTETECSGLKTGNPGAYGCLNSCLVTPWTSASGGLTYTSTNWGGLLLVDWTATMGEGFFYNFGGCFAAAGTTAAKKCGTDFEEQFECITQACATNCPFAAQGAPDFDGDQQDFYACENAVSASGGECATYGTAINTDCGALAADTGVLGECISIYDTFASSKSTATEIATAFSQLLNVICVAPGGGG